jgi:hypothetical protein
MKIDKNEIMQMVKDGKRVAVMLSDAKVVSVKREARVVGRGRVANATLFKIVAVDENLGPVFLSSFSDKLSDIDFGQMISLKVTITGVGDASEKYPDPILFSKPHIRGRDPITVRDADTTEIEADVDLTVNV